MSTAIAMERQDTVACLARVAWLQELLRERVAPALTLRLADAREWEIGLPGVDTALRLAPRQPCFYRRGAAPGCARWDGTSEGFAPPLHPVLPAPGDLELASPLVSRETGGLRLGYDLPGLVFWSLARMEEIGSTQRDLYDRFPVEASHAARHGYLDRPIVDEWIEVLRQVLERLWPGLVLPRPTFRVQVSHDVDEPSRYAFRSAAGFWRAVLGDLIRRGSPRDALAAPAVRFGSGDGLHRLDPYNTFDWIMECSERHGLRSAFYFLCGRTEPSRDGDYDPRHPAIRALMRRIHHRGHEIGLHPSYASYDRPDVIAQEARVLRRIAAEEGIVQSTWGGRMHYLRWQTPTTLRAWERAQLDYDSTLGYGPRPGFRCGTCFEYAAFDGEGMAPMQLRLRPLVAMEGSVIAARYQGLGLGRQAFDAFMAVRRACEAVGGQFTLLWHNSELQSAPARRLYEAVLRGHWEGS
jgi:hypothetical protein